MECLDKKMVCLLLSKFLFRGDNIMKKVTGDTIQFESRYELREIIESLNKQIEKSKEELPHSQDLVELLDAMYMNW